MSAGRLRAVVGSEPELDRLFNPRSIAVVGASGRPGTLSWWPLHLLIQRSYEGDIYPVNPTRAEVEGVRCFPSIESIPEGIDLCIVALNAEAAIQAAKQSADRGFGAVVLPTQGLGEQGPHGKKVELEMVDYVTRRGTRVAGPNADGVGNLSSGALATIQPLFGQRIQSGPLAVVTQSGATAGSLLNRLRLEGIGCRLYASTGNEADLGLEDYLSYMVQDPEVEMVLSFVESIRRPDAFRAVAELARDLGKPIALIKVGRSDQGARMAAAHTGSLAGVDRIYDSFFESVGIIRVDELSELVAVAKLYLSNGIPRSDGVGVVSVSGGQAGAIADLVTAAGLGVPPVDAATKSHLDDVLTFGEGFNPCDLTGDVARDASLAAEVYAGFAAQRNIGTVVYARKLLTGQAGIAAAERLGISHRASEGAPLVVYAMDGEVPPEERVHYDDADIPVFSSMHDLLVGLVGLDRHRQRVESYGPNSPVVERIADDVLRSQLGSGETIGEEQSKAILARFGIPAPESILATSEAAAVAAARQIGFPVVCKIASPDLVHKTEVGGVETGLSDDGAVARAYNAILHRVRQGAEGARVDGVLVQEQVQVGVEVILGVAVDEGFGPFVMVGLGGVFVEALRDTVLRPAPVDEEDARNMIANLQGRELLEGFRGTQAADIDALAGAIVQLSHFAVEYAGVLEAVDLNPVVVLEEGSGVSVLDALIIGRRRAES